MADALTSPVPDDRVVVVDDPVDLAAIYDDDVVAVVWRGAVCPHPLARPSGRCIVDVGTPPATLAPLHAVLELFGCLADCVSLGVRWRTSTEPMCPAFHVDRVELRATLSLLGPGTELLGTVGTVGHEGGPLVGAAGALVVMKGTLLHARGCLHRSPSTAAMRQIVTLDIVHD
jgi:hypothetical protein